MPIHASRTASVTGATRAADYDRRRDLPRLLRMWPAEVLALGEADRVGLWSNCARCCAPSANAG